MGPTACHGVGGKCGGRIDLGRLGDVVDLESGGQIREGHRILQDASPDPGGLVDEIGSVQLQDCLLYTSDAADE